MPTVFLNGQFVDSADARISAMDASIQHGVGLFETLVGGASPTGEPWALHIDEHVDRLVASANQLGLSGSLRGDGLREAALETIRRSGVDGHVRVRITVTGGDLNLLAAARRGGSEARPTEARPTQTVLISAQPATPYPDEMFERGIAVSVADARANPLNPMEGHKTLNYWWRLRELALAASRGAAEALVLQVTNHLAGGCVSNLIVIRDGQAMTPIARGEEPQGGTPPSPATGGPQGAKGAALPSPVLPGIVRAWALEQLAAAGVPTVRRMLSIADVLDADEVMLTNSSWGVLPVVKVEREAIADAVPGARTRELVGAWQTLLSETSA